MTFTPRIDSAMEAMPLLQQPQALGVKPSSAFFQIADIHLEADEALDSAFPRGEGGVAYAEKGIEHGETGARAVEADALRGEFHRECGGMRPLPGAALDGAVRDEPVVASAAQVAPVRVAPARDVALVRIPGPDGKAIHFNRPGLREVEDVFVAVGYESPGVDRLEMPRRQFRAVP